LRDEDFLIPGMSIRKLQAALATSASAFATVAAATSGEINLGVTAAAAKQNLFRAGADTVTALIANLDEGAFRYRPGWTMGYRSG